MSVLDPRARDTVGTSRRVGVGSGGVLLPDRTQLKVVRQKLPQEIPTTDVEEFFQLIMVQCIGRRIGEIRNERGE
ncbi:hypothetical protein OG762_49565 (plasmid) [Streptomyces sp. NBC_01136]|nr:hypothetical protein OG762_49565 [Streptomyces sp. NBC_01136]